MLGPAAPGRRWPDTAFSPGDSRPVRDTRPVYVTGRGQWACRQMALRTRSRSTCLRPTSKGSAALILLASHAPAPPVHPAPVIGAAGRGARSCGITFAQTPVSAGPIPLRWKIPKTLPARDAPGSAGWIARGARCLCSAQVSAGQRRSALADPGHRRLRPLSLTGRKVLAITPGAAGAVVVMALPAWNADHRIPPVRKPRRSGRGGAPGTARWIGRRRTAAGLAVAARVSLPGYVTSAMIREPLRAGDTSRRRCHLPGAAIPREPSGCRPLAMLGPVTSSQESSPFTAMEDVKRLSSRSALLAGRTKSAPRPVLAGTGLSWHRLRRGLRDWLDVCDGLRYREEADGLARQAALARRIRRRRSAARSSSFRPPHTPYFSGRDSA